MCSVICSKTCRKSEYKLRFSYKKKSKQVQNFGSVLIVLVIFVIYTLKHYRTVCKTVEVPSELKQVMTKDVLEKSRQYTLARGKYSLVKVTCHIIVTTAVLCSGVLAKIWNYAESLNISPGEVSTSCVWLFLLTTISTIIELPLTIYHTFVLEEKFDFNRQTAGFFVWDQIKGYILTQFLMLGVSSVTIVVIKNGGEYFFVWLWLALSIILFIFVAIHPYLIAPLFDTFTPLPQGELRSQIEALASQHKFPLAQLYVVEGSKRSSHSNAYFSGTFKYKRIVLYDTLLAKDGSGYTNEEILSILSHELGHWIHNHLLKMVVVVEINYFLLFAFFSVIFKYPILYKVVGFYHVQPVLVGLIVLQYVIIPYNTFFSFFFVCLSRRFEFQADEFAGKLGKSEALISSLVRLHKDNLSFPIYDHMYSAWHLDHPPLLERIEKLKSVRH